MLFQSNNPKGEIALDLSAILPDLSHEDWSNWWMTAGVFAIIFLIVAIGYMSSRPIKKPVKTTQYYGGMTKGSPNKSALRSIPQRPVVGVGNPANVRQLREAPRRSMHRTDDTDYYVPVTLPDIGNDPVHGGPHIASEPHANNNHGISHTDHGYSSGSYSDSGSSYGGDSGGSSGGGDGGGGGGGD